MPAASLPCQSHPQPTATRGAGSSVDGDGAGGPLKVQLPIGGVDAHRVALGELALEQRQGELVDQLALDHPLQGPRAVGRVVAEVAEQGAGIAGELDLDPALEQATHELGDLEV